MSQKIAIITGAHGLLGSILKKEFEKNGYIVYSLVRDPKSDHDLYFSLQEQFDWTQISAKVDILIHAAYDFYPTEKSDVIEINGYNSISFLQSAREFGIQNILYISSMAAYNGTKSLYGNCKILVEDHVISINGIIVRPGLIWGKELKGIFGALKNLILKVPLIPLIGYGDQVLYLAHEQDLASAINEISNKFQNFNSKVIILASDEPIEFKEVLKRIAKSVGKWIFLIPIPWWVFYSLLRILEIIKIKPPFKSDSLISLINQDKNPDFSYLSKLETKFRKFI
ncbi:NAD-dependent epimerase/dehydratase family protein [Leptospira sp. GIMC2001]|uniref:NAD-dependent epimerase/dehydratase family protein n=1 Tax=Leptospira sp. GIMC2001 TaxID=1513297 RepID=UPI00234ACC56|nr:NAD-dependent epimerase/dehydratase family protein [Leptospira sp. GIMC2001]WCL51272.1 NAD-dependent epimerase/dehydratase family protein [Leptospira sp. GIMC2001]